MIHYPVLLKETIEYLAPKNNEIYVDGTMGMGGHTAEILEKSKPDGRVIGLDWDEEALALARERLSVYGDRLRTFRRNYAEISECLKELGISKLNGIVLDLGMSSYQLDLSSRGFTFKGSEPLDMRMDNRGKTTAAELLNSRSADELADIFFYYGEERQSRRIAARIVEERKNDRIETTDRLAGIVAQAVPKRFHPKKIHVATKVFQALRIAVNRELENLKNILDEAPALIVPGGRLCIISFHSLEDRLIKWKFREHSSFNILTKKPVIASEIECRENPRSRSAKLRAATIK